MDNYVDGYLLAIPQANLEKYRTMAQAAGEVWKEHGALDYRECVGDDLATEFGTSFSITANAREDDVVIFAWIVFSSKSERDRINAAVMTDPRLKDCMENVFDFKRMSCGGFKTLVSL